MEQLGQQNHLEQVSKPVWERLYNKTVQRKDKLQAATQEAGVFVTNFQDGGIGSKFPGKNGATPGSRQGSVGRGDNSNSSAEGLPKGQTSRTSSLPSITGTRSSNSLPTSATANDAEESSTSELRPSASQPELQLVGSPPLGTKPRTTGKALVPSASPQRQPFSLSVYGSDLPGPRVVRGTRDQARSVSPARRRANGAVGDNSSSNLEAIPPINSPRSGKSNGYKRGSGLQTGGALPDKLAVPAQRARSPPIELPLISPRGDSQKFLGSPVQKTVSPKRKDVATTTRKAVKLDTGLTAAPWYRESAGIPPATTATPPWGAVQPWGEGDWEEQAEPVAAPENTVYEARAESPVDGQALQRPGSNESHEGYTQAADDTQEPLAPVHVDDNVLEADVGDGQAAAERQLPDTSRTDPDSDDTPVDIQQGAQFALQSEQEPGADDLQPEATAEDAVAAEDPSHIFANDVDVDADALPKEEAAAPVDEAEPNSIPEGPVAEEFAAQEEPSNVYEPNSGGPGDDSAANPLPVAAEEPTQHMSLQDAIATLESAGDESTVPAEVVAIVEGTPDVSPVDEATALAEPAEHAATEAADDSPAGDEIQPDVVATDAGVATDAAVVADSVAAAEVAVTAEVPAEKTEAPAKTAKGAAGDAPAETPKKAVVKKPAGNAAAILARNKGTAIAQVVVKQDKPVILLQKDKDGLVLNPLDLVGQMLQVKTPSNSWREGVVAGYMPHLASCRWLVSFEDCWDAPEWVDFSPRFTLVNRFGGEQAGVRWITCQSPRWAPDTDGASTSSKEKVVVRVAANGVAVNPEDLLGQRLQIELEDEEAPLLATVQVYRPARFQLQYGNTTEASDWGVLSPDLTQLVTSSGPLPLHWLTCSPSWQQAGQKGVAEALPEGKAPVTVFRTPGGRVVNPSELLNQEVEVSMEWALERSRGKVTKYQYSRPQYRWAIAFPMNFGSEEVWGDWDETFERFTSEDGEPHFMEWLKVAPVWAGGVSEAGSEKEGEAEAAVPDPEPPAVVLRVSPDGQVLNSADLIGHRIMVNRGGAEGEAAANVVAYAPPQWTLQYGPQHDRRFGTFDVPLTHHVTEHYDPEAEGNAATLSAPAKWLSCVPSWEWESRGAPLSKLPLQLLADRDGVILNPAVLIGQRVKLDWAGDVTGGIVAAYRPNRRPFPWLVFQYDAAASMGNFGGDLATLVGPNWSKRVEWCGCAPSVMLAPEKMQLSAGKLADAVVVQLGKDGAVLNPWELIGREVEMDRGSAALANGATRWRSGRVIAYRPALKALRWLLMFDSETEAGDFAPDFQLLTTSWVNRPLRWPGHMLRGETGSADVVPSLPKRPELLVELAGNGAALRPAALMGQTIMVDRGEDGFFSSKLVGHRPARWLLKLGGGREVWGVLSTDGSHLRSVRGAEQWKLTWQGPAAPRWEQAADAQEAAPAVPAETPVVLVKGPDGNVVDPMGLVGQRLVITHYWHPRKCTVMGYSRQRTSYPWLIHIDGYASQWADFSPDFSCLLSQPPSGRAMTEGGSLRGLISRGAPGTAATNVHADILTNQQDGEGSVASAKTPMGGSSRINRNSSAKIGSDAGPGHFDWFSNTMRFNATFTASSFRRTMTGSRAATAATAASQAAAGAGVVMSITWLTCQPSWGERAPEGAVVAAEPAPLVLQVAINGTVHNPWVLIGQTLTAECDSAPQAAEVVDFRPSQWLLQCADGAGAWGALGRAFEEHVTAAGTRRTITWLACEPKWGWAEGAVEAAGLEDVPKAAVELSRKADGTVANPTDLIGQDVMVRYSSGEQYKGTVLEYQPASAPFPWRIAHTDGSSEWGEFTPDFGTHISRSALHMLTWLHCAPSWAAGAVELQPPQPPGKSDQDVVVLRRLADGGCVDPEMLIGHQLQVQLSPGGFSSPATPAEVLAYDASGPAPRWTIKYEDGNMERGEFSHNLRIFQAASLNRAVQWVSCWPRWHHEVVKAPAAAEVSGQVVKPELVMLPTGEVENPETLLGQRVKSPEGSGGGLWLVSAYKPPQLQLQLEGGEQRWLPLSAREQSLQWLSCRPLWRHAAGAGGASGPQAVSEDGTPAKVAVTLKRSADGRLLNPADLVGHQLQVQMQGMWIVAAVAAYRADRPKCRWLIEYEDDDAEYADFSENFATLEERGTTHELFWVSCTPSWASWTPATEGELCPVELLMGEDGTLMTPDNLMGQQISVEKGDAGRLAGSVVGYQPAQWMLCQQLMEGLGQPSRSWGNFSADFVNHSGCDTDLEWPAGAPQWSYHEEGQAAAEAAVVVAADTTLVKNAAGEVLNPGLILGQQLMVEKESGERHKALLAAYRAFRDPFPWLLVYQDMSSEWGDFGSSFTTIITRSAVRPLGWSKGIPSTLGVPSGGPPPTDERPVITLFVAADGRVVNAQELVGQSVTVEVVVPLPGGIGEMRQQRVGQVAAYRPSTAQHRWLLQFEDNDADWGDFSDSFKVFMKQNANWAVTWNGCHPRFESSGHQEAPSTSVTVGLSPVTLLLEPNGSVVNPWHLLGQPLWVDYKDAKLDKMKVVAYRPARWLLEYASGEEEWGSLNSLMTEHITADGRNNLEWIDCQPRWQMTGEDEAAAAGAGHSDLLSRDSITLRQAPSGFVENPEDLLGHEMLMDFGYVQRLGRISGWKVQNGATVFLALVEGRGRNWGQLRGADLRVLQSGRNSHAVEWLTCVPSWGEPTGQVIPQPGSSSTLMLKLSSTGVVLNAVDLIGKHVLVEKGPAGRVMAQVINYQPAAWQLHITAFQQRYAAFSVSMRSLKFCDDWAPAFRTAGLGSAVPSSEEAAVQWLACEPHIKWLPPDEVGRRLSSSGTASTKRVEFTLQRSSEGMVLNANALFGQALLVQRGAGQVRRARVADYQAAREPFPWMLRLEPEGSEEWVWFGRDLTQQVSATGSGTVQWLNCSPSFADAPAGQRSQAPMTPVTPRDMSLKAVELKVTNNGAVLNPEVLLGHRLQVIPLNLWNGSVQPQQGLVVAYDPTRTHRKWLVQLETATNGSGESQQWVDFCGDMKICALTGGNLGVLWTSCRPSVTLVQDNTAKAQPIQRSVVRLKVTANGTVVNPVDLMGQQLVVCDEEDNSCKVVAYRPATWLLNFGGGSSERGTLSEDLRSWQSNGVSRPVTWSTCDPSWERGVDNRPMTSTSTAADVAGKGRPKPIILRRSSDGTVLNPQALIGKKVMGMWSHIDHHRGTVMAYRPFKPQAPWLIQYEFNNVMEWGTFGLSFRNHVTADGHSRPIEWIGCEVSYARAGSDGQLPAGSKFVSTFTGEHNPNTGQPMYLQSIVAMDDYVEMSVEELRWQERPLAARQRTASTSTSSSDPFPGFPVPGLSPDELRWQEEQQVPDSPGGNSRMMEMPASRMFSNTSCSSSKLDFMSNKQPVRLKVAPNGKVVNPVDLYGHQLKVTIHDDENRTAEVLEYTPPAWLLHYDQYAPEWGNFDAAFTTHGTNPDDGLELQWRSCIPSWVRVSDGREGTASSSASRETLAAPAPLPAVPIFRTQDSSVPNAAELSGHALMVERNPGELYMAHIAATRHTAVPPFIQWLVAYDDDKAEWSSFSGDFKTLVANANNRTVQWADCAPEWRMHNGPLPPGWLSQRSLVQADPKLADAANLPPPSDGAAAPTAPAAEPSAAPAAAAEAAVPPPYVPSPLVPGMPSHHVAIFSGERSASDEPMLMQTISAMPEYFGMAVDELRWKEHTMWQADGRLEAPDSFAPAQEGQVELPPILSASVPVFSAVPWFTPKTWLAPFSFKQQTQKPAATAAAPATEEEIQRMHELDAALKSMSSIETAEQLAGTRKLRQLLSLPGNPLLGAVVERHATPHLVELLKRWDCDELQFEAAWSITNIAAGSSEHTQHVIDAWAVPPLVALIPPRNGKHRVQLQEQAVWALGNIAGDGVGPRDNVIKQGALPPLLTLLSDESTLKNPALLRTATWTLANLCRGQPLVDTETVLPAVPVLVRLLGGEDDEVLTDACSSLASIADGEEARKQAVIDSGCCPRLLDLCSHRKVGVAAAAIRTLGQVLAGSEEQSQAMLDLGVLKDLGGVLANSKKKVMLKDAAWAVSNVTAGGPERIQQVLDAGIASHLLEHLDTHENEDVKRECAMAIANATISGTTEQVRTLVGLGAIPVLSRAAGNSSPRVVLPALNALSNVLHAGRGLPPAPAMTLQGLGLASSTSLITDAAAVTDASGAPLAPSTPPQEEGPKGDAPSSLLQEGLANLASQAEASEDAPAPAPAAAAAVTKPKGAPAKNPHAAMIEAAGGVQALCACFTQSPEVVEKAHELSAEPDWSAAAAKQMQAAIAAANLPKRKPAAKKPAAAKPKNALAKLKAAAKPLPAAAAKAEVGGDATAAAVAVTAAAATAPADVLAAAAALDNALVPVARRASVVSVASVANPPAPVPAPLMASEEEEAAEEEEEEEEAPVPAPSPVKERPARSSTRMSNLLAGTAASAAKVRTEKPVIVTKAPVDRAPKASMWANGLRDDAPAPPPPPAPRQPSPQKNALRRAAAAAAAAVAAENDSRGAARRAADEAEGYYPEDDRPISPSKAAASKASITASVTASEAARNRVNTPGRSQRLERTISPAKSAGGGRGEWQ